MKIFEISKRFASEEKYALTDQVRRSSRSVVVAIAEAYFVSKASDADMENSETRVWLEFAWSCKYLSDDLYHELYEKAIEIGKLLNHIVHHSDKYVRKSG